MKTSVIVMGWLNWTQVSRVGGGVFGYGSGIGDVHFGSVCKERLLPFKKLCFISTVGVKAVLVDNLGKYTLSDMPLCFICESCVGRQSR